MVHSAMSTGGEDLLAVLVEVHVDVRTLTSQKANGLLIVRLTATWNPDGAAEL